MCGKNLPYTHMVRDTTHAQWLEMQCIVNYILWEMSELITQERTTVMSSNMVEVLTS